MIDKRDQASDNVGSLAVVVGHHRRLSSDSMEHPDSISSLSRDRGPVGGRDGGHDGGRDSGEPGQ